MFPLQVKGPRLAKLMAIGAASVILGTAAQAQTDTFNVTASVGAACSVSASNLGFGAYDPLSATDTDATTTMDVTCTLSTTYNVGLDGGISGNTSARTMDDAGGTNTLNYALYSDAPRTSNWGNSVGTDTVAGTGTGAAQTLTVYGRITALQSVPAGSYEDTITVTVTF